MFAVTGGKGGCGKTTTALGLAQALARRGADPLVVDADVDMPDLHLLADVPAEPNASDLAEGAHVECVRHRPEDNPGVSIVPAGTAELTPTALRALTAWHGPVLVDCPAGAGEAATVPLRHSEGSILVTTDTPQSLSDAAKTARVADRLDAPVRGALIRGPDADSVSVPPECRPTETVETVETRTDENVLTDRRFRFATDELSDVITERRRGLSK